MRYGETVKPYSDCSAQRGYDGLVAAAVQRTRGARPGQLVEGHDGRHPLVGALHLGDRGRAHRVADDRDPGGPARGRRTRVGGAVERLPVGVEGAHLRALGARVGVVLRGCRGEERQRVLGADDEVGQLLGRGARAAVRLAVPRGGERVAERERVARRPPGQGLVGEGLAAALALHVVGEHDVAALGEVLGQPAVHPLAALHRALGDHRAGERSAQHLAGVGVASARPGPVDGAVQQGAVPVGERDPLAERRGCRSSRRAAGCRRSSPAPRGRA